ncbi:hypothetical protein [Comamonas thiooxydans]|uniref:hypothetical protein n=1 Tax=Comamonas thiooxydans TaxID=363952 RepID=UPI001A94A7FE|nr:hypothetical protein [Comamonas thiooxydans]
MRKIIFPILIGVSGISGCATSSKDIASQYISPMQYNNFSCDQLSQETQRLNARIGQVGGRLDEASSNDKMITAGGFLLWPAFFFLGGTKEQEAEYGRLKGEYDAVQQASISKQCMTPKTLDTNTKPIEHKSEISEK